jgi:hypothetical protein
VIIYAKQKDIQFITIMSNTSFVRIKGKDEAKRACVFINSEQKGFFISISNILENFYGYNVTIVCADKHVKLLVDKLIPNRKNDYVMDSIDIEKCTEDNVIEQAKDIENRYGFLLAQLMSGDRGLGQGYLFNVEKVPDIIRASWSYEKKLCCIVDTIKKYEVILKDCNLVIQQWPSPDILGITKKNNCKIFSLVMMKYGDRFFWTDGHTVSGSKFIKRINDNITSNKIMSYNEAEYIIETSGDEINKEQMYTWTDAFNEAMHVYINDTKNWIRGINKKNSYRYLGWVLSPFRKVRNYNYVQMIGKNPDDLIGCDYVYFSLHCEPEVSMLYYSPEFSNSMEAIAWISKSLPAGMLIVVKEQSVSYSVRSKWYYRQLSKIPNVVWAEPSVHSWEWIKHSKIVSTVTGAAGIEAVSMLKPVISFGKHQAINNLPTVQHVSSFQEVADALNNILYNDITSGALLSKKSFIKAQIDSSFDFPQYKDNFASEEINNDMAQKALKELSDEYGL